MRLVLLSFLVGTFSLPAFGAGLEEVTCTAEQWEVVNQAVVNHQKLDMKASKEGAFTFLKAKVGERAYTVNETSTTDEFFLSQSWGPDYTSGILTTLAFGSSKRVQLSFVDNNKVFKIVCLKK